MQLIDTIITKFGCILMTSRSFECTCILKSFCHFLVNFQKLLYSHLFVQFDLTKVWKTRAACFRDTYILGQNVCPDSNVQHEQIISPLQRNYEGGHIVLIWVFLLILFILKQPCSGCNSFILWYRLRYLICRCITIRCFAMDHYHLHVTFASDFKVK